MKKDPLTITVGELRSQLEGWPADMRLIFGSEGLEFYRLTQRGPNLLQIEFNQTVWDENGVVRIDNHEPVEELTAKVSGPAKRKDP